MLVFCVMQDGAVMLSRTYLTNEDDIAEGTEVHVVGHLLRQGKEGLMYYMHNMEPKTAVEMEDGLATVHFLPNLEDDDA